MCGSEQANGRAAHVMMVVMMMMTAAAVAIRGRVLPVRLWTCHDPFKGTQAAQDHRLTAARTSKLC